MNAISKEYANNNNGGRERFTTDGINITVNSFIPQVGWMGERKVTREQAADCLAYTNAPADVIAEVLK